MKNIHVIGINHITAPTEIREQFCLTDIQQDLFLSDCKSEPTILEAFILSTCNRTEAYINVLDGFNPFNTIIEKIGTIKKLTYSTDIKKYFYTHQEERAVEHLFRVVTGLDSLVLGEKQILGQVKTAIERARQKGMFDKKFNILSNLALRTGKKAQSETQISFGGSSVSWAAIVKGEQMLGSLEGRSILVIGAGKMSDLTVGQIQNKGFKKLYLMNRTHANAEDLAKKYGGIAVSLYDIREVLTEVDLCICSSSAPHYILEKSPVEKIMSLRSQRPLVMIDISMPRNIDPKVGEVEGVSLFEIDDLKEVVDSSMKMRQQSVSHVESIIADKLIEYHHKINSSQPELIDDNQAAI